MATFRYLDSLGLISILFIVIIGDYYGFFFSSPSFVSLCR